MLMATDSPTERLQVGNFESLNIMAALIVTASTSNIPLKSFLSTDCGFLRRYSQLRSSREKSRNCLISFHIVLDMRVVAL